MKYLLPQIGPQTISYQQHVKEANIKRIFDLVRSGKCTSRAELVRTMKLSATSVSVLVEELAERGLIDEIGPQQTFQPGRRPISLQYTSDARQIVVFRLSRDGVRYDLLDLDCHLLESLSVPFDSAVFAGDDSGDRYTEIFSDILLNRAQRFDLQRTALVGICSAGIYSDDSHALLVQSAMGTSITESALRAFQRRIRVPLLVANRTMCMAYAEKKRIDADNPIEPETQYMLFVRVNESIRGAVINAGDLYVGPYNLPVEIGHFCVDFHGRPCPCGSVGYLERYVNMDLILQDAQQACARAGVTAPVSIDDLSAHFLNHPAVMEVLNSAAELLSVGLYTAVNATGVRTVVLGGGLSALGNRFLHQVYRAVMRRSLIVHRLDLRYAKVGDDSDSIGLAQYFLDKLFTVTM